MRSSLRLLRTLLALLTTMALGLLGCTDATYGMPDLPDDWQGATRVDRLEQSECGDVATQGPPAEITLATQEGTIEVSYTHAAFRCGQDVEAYVRTDGDVVDVLVQPVNLNPPLIARCSCKYEVALVLPAPKKERFASGSYQVNVFRRSDNVGRDDNEPEAVGSQRIDVE